MCSTHAHSLHVVTNLTLYQQILYECTSPRFHQQNETSSSPELSWESFDQVFSHPGRNARSCWLYTHFHSSAQYNTMTYCRLLIQVSTIRITYPIHASKVHSHAKCFRTKVNTFGDVGEKLMVEGLNPVGISTLQ